MNSLFECFLCLSLPKHVVWSQYAGMQDAALSGRFQDIKYTGRLASR
jgi:hypothetical protein